MIKGIEEAIEKRLSKLVNNDSLETTPFRERLSAKRLLWIFGVMDDGHEIQLLRGILDAEEFKGEQQLFVKLLGDPSFYNGDYHKRPQYYVFEINDIDDYYQNRVIQGSARVVFSQSEDWLLLVSFEMYGLLGATDTLMEKIEASIPSLADYYNRQDFIDYWESCAQENGADISWTKELLAHINT